MDGRKCRYRVRHILVNLTFIAKLIPANERDIVIVIVLVNGEACDSLGQPVGLLSLDDVTALEVDWRF